MLLIAVTPPLHALNTTTSVAEMHSFYTEKKVHFTWDSPDKLQHVQVLLFPTSTTQHTMSSSPKLHTVMFLYTAYHDGDTL